MVFVTASILLSVWVGVWAVRLYLVTGGPGELAMAGFFFILAGVLIWYGFKVFRKLKELA